MLYYIQLGSLFIWEISTLSLWLKKRKRVIVPVFYWTLGFVFHIWLVEALYWNPSFIIIILSSDYFWFVS